MLTDSTLVAIDQVLGGDTHCRCGRNLTPIQRDGGLWMACDSNLAPSRLPAALVAFSRKHLHDNTFVLVLPGAVPVPQAVRPIGTTRTAAAHA